jgi:hypothetical protein
MLTKEHARLEHSHKEMPKFREPEAWMGTPPQKPIEVCFAATHVEAWQAGSSAVICWGGKRFRIVCEGKQAAETTCGILVGE